MEENKRGGKKGEKKRYKLIPPERFYSIFKTHG